MLMDTLSELSDKIDKCSACLDSMLLPPESPKSVEMQ